jgi:hypothetical protein
MSGLSEKDMREFDELYNAAMEEQRKMKALENDAIDALKKIILQHYPEVYNLESEGYKALEDVVWRVADKFVTDVNHVAYTMQIKA